MGENMCYDKIADKYVILSLFILMLYMISVVTIVGVGETIILYIYTAAVVVGTFYVLAKTARTKQRLADIFAKAGISSKLPEKLAGAAMLIPIILLMLGMDIVSAALLATSIMVSYAFVLVYYLYRIEIAKMCSQVEV